jgi:hypothetical protein
VADNSSLSRYTPHLNRSTPLCGVVRPWDAKCSTAFWPYRLVVRAGYRGRRAPNRQARQGAAGLAGIVVPATAGGWSSTVAGSADRSDSGAREGSRPQSRAKHATTRTHNLLRLRRLSRSHQFPHAGKGPGNGLKRQKTAQKAVKTDRVAAPQRGHGRTKYNTISISASAHDEDGFLLEALHELGPPRVTYVAMAPDEPAEGAPRLLDHWERYAAELRLNRDNVPPVVAKEGKWVIARSGANQLAQSYTTLRAALKKLVFEEKAKDAAR